MSAISGSSGIVPTGPVDPSATPDPADAASTASTDSTAVVRGSGPRVRVTASAPGDVNVDAFRFSENVLAGVLAEHGLTDRDAVIREAALHHNDGNRYLNTGELEAAAEALIAGTAGEGAPDVNIGSFDFSDRVVDRVLANHGLSDRDALLSEAALRHNDGNKYLNTAELTAAAEALVANATSTPPSGGLTGYQFSDNVVGRVMADHGLTDRDGLLREAAARHDDGNHYLNRAELEAAAIALAGTGGTGGTGPVGGTGAVPRSQVGLNVIPGVRLEADAISYVEGTLGLLGASEAAEAQRMLVEASGTDANKVLTLTEAEHVLEPVLAALPGGAGDVQAALRDVDAFLDTQRAMEADLADGVDALFNSERGGPSLTARVIQELDDAVAEANGRPLDINIMIFSFTDQSIADKLVEVAQNNPNANIRMLTDWTQTSTSNGYKPARLAAMQIPNLEVKFKKDQPYIWDSTRNRPRFNHSTTRGLNHHKGLVTLIDGKPRSMIAGSFNWSPTAESKNYENLMVLDSENGQNRTVMRHYEEEFEAFWNDGRASLTQPEASRHRRLVSDALEAGTPPGDVEGLASGAGSSIDLLAADDVVDVNDFSNAAALADLFGGGQPGMEIARAIHAERREFGRFSSVDDLAARIPTVATLDPAVLDRVRGDAAFGTGLLSVNTATSEELQAAGATAGAAAAIIAHRDTNGDFESLQDVRGLAGVSASAWRRMEGNLTDDVNRVAFSARMMHEDRGDSGYARVNEEKLVPVLGPDGQTVTMESATLGAGAVDMMRRVQSGETIKLAAYGLSSSTPEYAALVAAARRGVTVRVVLNKAYNEGVANALRDLATSEGLDIEVKVSGKTMHQKYLVHPEGDDVFNGSANLSGSSARKHSEDRFFFKNNPALADAFETDFDRLWGRLQ